MTRPSPTIGHLRQLLHEFVRRSVASEGEPAALGKSATAGSDVFYNDGTTIHEDRVWVRTAANLQVLTVALVPEGLRIPDIANTPIEIAYRYGMPYVTKVKPAQAVTGVGIHRFPAWIFGPPDAASITNPTFTWFWKYGNVDGSEVVTTFITTQDSTELTVEFWWYDLAATPANVVWSLAFSSEADGEAFNDSWEWFFHTVSGTTQFAIHKEIFTFSFTAHSFTAGDIVQMHISRRGGHANDTSSGDAGFVHAIVYEEGTYSA